MAAKYEMNLTEGSIINKLIRFSFPLILSSILQLLFNTADVVVVGQFAGESSLAAVGSTSALINLIVNLFFGISIGANVLAGQCYGANNVEKMHKVVRTAISVALIGGIITCFVGFFVAKDALILMDTKADVLPKATLYMKIYFLGMPGFMLYNFGSAILRAAGDTKRPLIFLSISGVVNVCLNLLLVIVFKLDVAGVAVATIVSQYLSAVMVITCLIRTNSSIKLDIKHLKIDMDVIGEMLAIGLAAGFQSIVFSLSNVLIQSAVNSFDNTLLVAGNTAASNVEGYVYTTMNSVAQSALCFVSQNIGAKKIDRIPKIVKSAILLAIIFGGLTGTLAIVFGPKLLLCYNKNPDMIQYGMKSLLVLCSTYFLCGIMDVLASSIRGLGHSVLPMVVSIIGACLMRIVWILTIFKVYHTQYCLYISYPISWILTAGVHLIVFCVILKNLRKNENFSQDQ